MDRFFRPPTDQIQRGWPWKFRATTATGSASFVGLDSPGLDGERIEQEDLVAWVTLGKEHLPRTEDVPLISNFGTYFVVSPHNQWHGNAAMDLMKSEM